ncbi:MAG: DUF2127 domain-containing protein, partial [Gemmatimonadetes bacterium]
MSPASSPGSPSIARRAGACGTPIGRSWARPPQYAELPDGAASGSGSASTPRRVGRLPARSARGQLERHGHLYALAALGDGRDRRYGLGRGGDDVHWSHARATGPPPTVDAAAPEDRRGGAPGIWGHALGTHAAGFVSGLDWGGGDGGALRAIAVYKFCKAVLLVIVALGALQLSHPEVAARAQRWVEAFAASSD